ncbi:MAG: hypothetical protein QOH27_748, partial [Mycobacterium sp.]|nr:hypothetical protein [Mycobacterium sp.]
VDNALLRGRTSLPHAVQAAQYFAREASGDDRIHALSVMQVDPTSEGKTIRVVLQGESGPIEVLLREQISDPLLSKCGATVPGRVRVFALVSITAAS